MPRMKMKFTGRAIDKVSGEVVTWEKGGIIDAEIDGLLPDTFAYVASNRIQEQQARPRNNNPRRVATRKGK